MSGRKKLIWSAVLVAVVGSFTGATCAETNSAYPSNAAGDEGVVAASHDPYISERAARDYSRASMRDHGAPAPEEFLFCNRVSRSAFRYCWWNHFAGNGRFQWYCLVDKDHTGQFLWIEEYTVYVNCKLNDNQT